MYTRSYIRNVICPEWTGKIIMYQYLCWGLSTIWKQVIAYCFTVGKYEGEQLKSIIMKIIGEIFQIVLKTW